MQPNKSAPLWAFSPLLLLQLISQEMDVVSTDICGEAKTRILGDLRRVFIGILRDHSYAFSSIAIYLNRSVNAVNHHAKVRADLLETDDDFRALDERIRQRCREYFIDAKC